jgi:hypothetical protein
VDACATFVVVVVVVVVVAAAVVVVVAVDVSEVGIATWLGLGQL